MADFTVVKSNELGLDLSKSKTRGKVYGYPFADIRIGDSKSYAVVPLEADGNFSKVKTRIINEHKKTFGGTDKGFHPNIVEHDLVLKDGMDKAKYAVVWLDIHPKFEDQELAKRNAEAHNAAIEAAEADAE